MLHVNAAAQQICSTRFDTAYAPAESRLSDLSMDG